MNPVVFSTGFSACRRYIFGRCRRRSTWFDNLRFCVYESCAQSWTWKRNYTRKDFFRNRVYENRNQMLIFAVNRRLNIHDFRMRTSMSILPVDFRFQAGNPYTRFSKKASHVQSLLFGQGDVFILVWFSWDAYAERLFLFAHPIRLPLSIYISVPPRANKQKNRQFFLCVRMPRWNTARFSDHHRARPGNFYWRTGWNRWRWMALSNTRLFSKSWIFLTPSIIFVYGAKLSKIFK